MCVLFNRRHKVVQPPLVEMDGTLLPYQNSVRYLGVTLDSKLSWTKHVEAKIASAKAKTLLFKNAVGKLWGLPPYLMRWCYTGIVRPGLTYGSLVWSRVVEKKTIQQKLQRVNRLALLSMAKIRRSTPTAGLEVLANVMPLHLHIKAEACSALLRTESLSTRPDLLKRVVQLTGQENWQERYISLLRTHNGSGLSKRAELFRKATIGSRREKLALQKEHRTYLKAFLQGVGFEEEAHDGIAVMRVPKHFYELQKFTFLKGIPWHSAEYAVYTDGSKIRMATGSAFCVYRLGDPVHAEYFHLDADNSVFQAEIYAIKKAAEYLIRLGTLNNRIMIHVDSQAALLALNSTLFHTESVLNASITLNELGKNNTVKLRWVKAHHNYIGNELADTLAKAGAKANPMDLPDIPKKPRGDVMQQLQHALVTSWTNTWQSNPHCRQTKYWFPKPNEKLSKQLLKVGRKELSQLIQFITGHNYLNYHQSKTNPAIDPVCRLCLEDDEEAIHIATNCPALNWVRASCLGHYILIKGALEWSPEQVIRFLRESHVDELLDPVIYDH